MIGDARVLGLVTARGGSKGLPGKNIKPLHGKPLIAWTIEAAHQSFLIDDLIVSTDCEKIADIARCTGAEVPFLRPAEFAADTSTSFDAIKHALDWLKKDGRSYEYIVLLEPTSPLREATDIDNALQNMIAKNATAIVGVCKTETMHPEFMYRKNKLGRLTAFIEKENKALRRQDIDDLFFLEGSVYASKVDTFLDEKGFYHAGTLGYEVPKWKSPEIDDEIDFLFIEAIMQHKKGV